MTKIDRKFGFYQVANKIEDQDVSNQIQKYNQRGNEVLGDIPQTCRVVDSVLVWDTDYNEHLKHVWKTLERCNDHGITLNGEKFVFGADGVEFCG